MKNIVVEFPPFGIIDIIDVEGMSEEEINSVVDDTIWEFVESQGFNWYYEEGEE